MTTFQQQYSDAESAFVRGFRYHSTCTQCVCDCGRVYFTTAATGGDFEENELEELIASEKKTPDKYISSWEFDSIDVVRIGGKEFVPQCVCEGAKKYLDFFEAHFDKLARYCVARLEQKRVDVLRESSDVARMLNGLKDAK